MQRPRNTVSFHYITWNIAEKRFRKSVTRTRTAHEIRTYLWTKIVLVSFRLSSSEFRGQRAIWRTRFIRAEENKSISHLLEVTRSTKLGQQKNCWKNKHKINQKLFSNLSPELLMAEERRKTSSETFSRERVPCSTHLGRDTRNHPVRTETKGESESQTGSRCDDLKISSCRPAESRNPQTPAAFLLEGPFRWVWDAARKPENWVEGWVGAEQPTVRLERLLMEDSGSLPSTPPHGRPYPTNSKTRYPRNWRRTAHRHLIATADGDDLGRGATGQDEQHADRTRWCPPWAERGSGRPRKTRKSSTDYPETNEIWWTCGSAGHLPIRTCRCVYVRVCWRTSLL